MSGVLGSLAHRLKISKPSICLVSAFNDAYEPIAGVTVSRMK